MHITTYKFEVNDNYTGMLLGLKQYISYMLLRVHKDKVAINQNIYTYANIS